MNRFSVDGVSMRSLLPLFVFALPTAAFAQQPNDSVVAVETFDRAWTVIHDTYFDTTFAGLDWDAVREELRPQVAASPDQATVRRVIRDMVGRFGQSHFALIPSEIADSLDPSDDDVRDAAAGVGIDVRLIGDQLVVTTVDGDGSAAQAGVRPGWVITAIGDDRMQDLVEHARTAESRRHISSMIWGRVQQRLRGDAGTDCTIEFLDGSDQLVTLTLPRMTMPGDPVKLGHFPTIFARFGRTTVPLPGGNGAAGIASFTAWMTPITRQINSAFEDFRALDGIIVDLRGNAGGVAAMVMGVAGHFLDTKVSLGTMKTRSGNLEFRVNPRIVDSAGDPLAPFTGPVAVLVDRLSGSASEVFAGGMQALGRVRVFGDTTAGAVLPASFDRLPNRDVLYHAVGDFEAPTGVRLEGRGVYPDETVPLTREAFLSDRDPVLAASLEWIESMSAPGIGSR
jgi:carboxyl-terminal processing protease